MREIKTLIHQHQKRRTIIKNWSIPHFFIFCFHWSRCPCNPLKWYWTMILQNFFEGLSKFGLGHWLLCHSFTRQSTSQFTEECVFLVCYWIYHWSMSHSSIKKSIPAQRSLVSTHNRQFSKEQVLNCIFRHFSSSSLSEIHTVCSQIFSCIYKKCQS